VTRSAEKILFMGIGSNPYSNNGQMSRLINLAAAISGLNSSFFLLPSYFLLLT
jgi:hypothetical protein